MRSLFPQHPARERLLTGLLLVAALTGLTACGDNAAGDESSPVASASGAAPDRVVAGPQGIVGQFVVECTLDHRATDDPIVHPGHAGASHLHQFFGVQGVDADSTYDELIERDTTCAQQSDTASYWAPTLLDSSGGVVEPIGSVAYYRAGPGVDPALVQPYPSGLMLVGGNAHAVEPQPVSIVAWSCGTGSVRETTPPDCSGAPSLRMLITYPDCWNGTDLAAGDWFDPAQRHTAYSAGGECPAGFSVHIPQLQFAIDYPPIPAAELGALSLSSGDILSGHADFWNTWDQAKLEREVHHCINRNLVCNVSG